MIKVLASGSKGNAYMVGNGILLECGIPYDSFLKKAGYPKIRACILTHLHSDHTKYIDTINRYRIPIYASRETLTGLNLKSYENCFAIRADCDYEINGVTVYPYDAEHCDGALYFVFEKDSERVLFSTDNAVIHEDHSGLTEIYIEANYSELMLEQNIAEGLIDPARVNSIISHMSIESCEDWLCRQDLSKVRSVRLLHLSDTNSYQAEFIKRIQRKTGIPTYGGLE